MTDASSFLTERERLRQFCLIKTRASIVLHDARRPKPVSFGEGDQISRIAELLQILLSVDANRFVDPDDACEDMMPSIFAFPSNDAKADAATICSAAKGSEPIIVDFRMTEMIRSREPLQMRRAVKTWDRTMRKRERFCAIITHSDAAPDAAIVTNGSRWLNRNDGARFDLLNGFWWNLFVSVSAQRCMIRDAWRRCDFRTEGTA